MMHDINFYAIVRAVLVSACSRLLRPRTVHVAIPRTPVSQVQKEGLGMDKCIEDAKYRMVQSTSI
jgi:hypothetical protein